MFSLLFAKEKIIPSLKAQHNSLLYFISLFLFIFIIIFLLENEHSNSKITFER